MKQTDYNRTKFSCYFTYVAGAAIFSLPPLLFLTFHEMYGISYTLLGTLVLINFFTQLGIDLVFTFFAKYFNVKLVVRLLPALTSAGLFLYALSPMVFPNQVYFGLVIGTILFSVSAGFSEVLLSPLIAAIPSETPDRDMAFLHSLYGWGVLSVVIISTVFLKIFGREHWMYLTMFWAALPLIACYLFCTSPIPEMSLSHEESGQRARNRAKGLVLCVLCIFFGSAAENAMTNWISSYMEGALGISKTVGDILGMAMFALLLSITRNVYAKIGKNISKVLLWGMTGAVLCYLAAGLSSNVFVSFAACILTGICTSMLWPGTLILMEERIPNPGVAAYALMAAGGDLGASVAPQLLGVVADSFPNEQLGLRAGMLVAALFPLMGVMLFLVMRKFFFGNKDVKNILQISEVEL